MRENQVLNKKILAQELATSQVGGVRKAWNTDSVASGLSPSKLAKVLSSANDGDIYDYLTLAEEMEEREPHYSSVLRTRKLALEGLERTIEAGSEVDEKIVQAVQDLINNSNFNSLLSGLNDALGKGFAAVEIIWHDFTPSNYIWRDPRYFTFAKDNAYTLLLKDEHNPAGVALPAYKFAIHLPKLKSGVPIRGGLARMAALSYMCKTYALTDWMAFCEVFGMPIRVGKYGAGASDDDKAVLKRAVTNIGTDAAAIIPESMHLEFIEALSSKGGENLFENLANWLDKQISKAVLGQTMTADDGSSQSQANVHNEVRLDLLKADALQLASTINEQIIIPFVNFNFGEQQHYPKLAFYIAQAEDLTALVEGIAKLVPLGLKVSQNFIRDKLGIPDPTDEDELLQSMAIGQMQLNSSQHDCHHIGLNHSSNDLSDLSEVSDDENEFVNMSVKAIEQLVFELQQAKDFNQLRQLLNNSTLNPSDITQALAGAGIKAFADGAADE